MSSFFSRRPLPTQQQFQHAISRGGNAWYVACVRITNDAELAQDAVQDALLKAWHKRQQFRGGALLETWIHRIAVNSAIALVRSQGRVDIVQLVETKEEGGCSPDAAITRSELSHNLSNALGSLSELERVCFVLKHLEEWRLSEIASQLDTGVGSVKQALFRAVKKLRVLMTSLRDL